MSDNAKKTTLRGIFWNTIDRFGYQIIITIVGIVTARILDVKDFHFMAALLIFSTIATSLTDSGLGTSLVRSKNVTEIDYSSMFVFNLTISLTFYTLLFFTAPMIENYFAIPNLAWFARILFLQLIIHALGIVQYVKVLKNMQFNISAKVTIISVTLSGIITLGLAYLQFGVWVLIIQPLSYTIFRTILYWYWGDWKLNFTFHRESLRRHLDFSISFMIGNLIGKAISPLYSSLISKQYDALQTGYHYQANKWGETPNLLISSIIQGTTLSTLTPLQDDYPRYINSCRKTMKTLAFILFPVNILAIVVAEPGFVLVLTEKYREAVPYFQILCFSGLFISLTDMNVNFLNIKGQSKLALKLEILKLILAILVLYLTFEKGILVIILGQLIVRSICYLYSTVFSRVVYGYKLILQVKDLLPSFLYSIFAGCIAYLPVYNTITDSNLLLMLVQITIFTFIYSLLNHVFKNTIWIDALKLVKSKLF